MMHPASLHSASVPEEPALRLEIVSRVGCKWCDRLKAYLARQDRRLVTWHQSAELDPQLHDYAELRDDVLDRAARAQSTYPFVFDCRTGRLVGGHDATIALVEAAKSVFRVSEAGRDEDF